MGSAYGECAQLSGASLLENGKDLRQLARGTDNTSASLQVAESVHINDSLGKQSRDRGGKTGDKKTSHAETVAVVEDENGNDYILGHDESQLAVRVEGEAVAEVVG